MLNTLRVRFKMKNEPLISVILPVYNAEEFVSESIDSILNQEYSNFELIIINDCSTDLSEEKIKKFEDNRIVYLKNSSNLGLIKTLNKAIDSCRGEFIARMDADDISNADRLSKQVAFLTRNEDYVLVGSSYKIFGAKSRVIRLPLTDTDCRTSLLTCSPFCHPATMFRAEVVKINTLKYCESYPHAEDYNFFQQLSKFGKVGNLSDILLNYRFHDNQVSNVYASKQIESRLKSSLFYSNLSMHNFVSDIYYKNKNNLSKDSLFIKGLIELIAFCDLKVSKKLLIQILLSSNLSLVLKYFYWRIK